MGVALEGRGNMCYFPSSAVCCFSHVAADYECHGFVHDLQGCTPQGGGSGKAGKSQLGDRGNEGERSIVEHGRGKAEALGLQSGTQAGRSLRAERDVWSWERKAKSGNLEQIRELSGKTGFCMKCLRGRWSEIKEKESAVHIGESRDTATSSTLPFKIKQNLPTECHYWKRQFQVSHPLMSHTVQSLLTCPHLLLFIPQSYWYFWGFCWTCPYSTQKVFFKRIVCSVVGQETTHWGVELSFLPRLLSILF